MPSVNAASIIGTGKNLAQGRDRIDAHWHNYDGVDLVNRTGTGLVAGDVVRLATTATAGSVALTDSVANHRPYVVAMATIADTALGEFARAGDVVVKSTGTIAIGEYVRKSATSKAIETTGVAQGNVAAIPDGTLGIAIGASAGGFTRVLWWPVNWLKTNNLLNASGTNQTVQNTTAETDITGSIASILAGTLAAAGGVVTVELAGVLNGWAEGSVPDKTCTIRLKYGTTTVVSIALTVTKEVGTSVLVNEPFEIIATLSAHGVTNDQRGFLRYHGRHAQASIIDVTPVVRRGAATEDSTATQTLKVTAQFNSANASNYLIVERVRVTQPPT